MTAHPYDDIHAFVLGELDQAKAREVEQHADACPTCAVLIAEAMNGIAALAALESPRALTQRAAAARAPVPPVDRRRWNAAPWLAGGLAAACVALLLWNWQLRSGMSPVPVVALVHSHFTHHQLSNPGSQSAGKALQSLDGRWMYVVADGLSPHVRYDVWETRGTHSSLVGGFTTDGAGRGTSYVEQAPGPINGVAITQTGRSPAQDADALRWP